MKYLLTGIESHPDFGFGITAEAYHKSADFLVQNKDHIPAFQQKEMPINFLYRHSIELYLKSLIIIIHQSLKLPYEDEPPESDKPMIWVNGKWQSLFSCHNIDELYFYLVKQLLIPNATFLKEMAPKGDWREYEVVTGLIPLIVKYDKDSSYFRYPITKKTQQLDKEKHSMKPISRESLSGMPFTFTQPVEGQKMGRVFLLCKDDNNQFTKGYQLENDVLFEVTSALQKTSDYLYGMHVQSRCTLCDGC